MSDKNGQVDGDALIKALTDGIGAELGRPVRSSYYELLKRLKVHEDFLNLDHSARQQVVDILALSMLYQTVVAPLESGRSFLSLALKANATHIRIGRDKLTPKISSHFDKCINAFWNILRAQNIPRNALSFPTLKSFIKNVLSAKEEAEREAVD